MKLQSSLLLSIIVLFLHGCTTSNEPTEWIFKTGDAILSHPVKSGNTLFFGSNDHNFYALDVKTQTARWIFKTTGPIQTQALVIDDAVYFSNANRIYALHKHSGSELWSYMYAPDSSGEPLDPWDYHHGAPIVVGSVIYFGLVNGNIYGFNLMTGKKMDQFTATDSAPILCTPTAKNGIIYFGDWNGIVYAYDTKLQDTLWTYATYAEKQYETFGQLNAGFTVYDSLLIFGARNPELQVLNIHTGKPIWNYVSEEGGWISGDPIVHNDTLYIGGSDNHKLFAFDVHDGRKIWEFEFLFNNFSKPLIINNQILFTTGDAGSAYRGDDGRGYLYSLDRISGQLRNFRLFEANVFSTPVVDEVSIYVASVDSQLFALSRGVFLTQPGNLKDRGYYSIELVNPSLQNFQESVSIKYQVHSETTVEVGFYDLRGSSVRQWPQQNMSPGDQVFVWDGKDREGRVVTPGYYYFEIISGQYCQTGYVQKVN
jgi:outer membrane protein assembly factor BamB